MSPNFDFFRLDPNNKPSTASSWAVCHCYASLYICKNIILFECQRLEPPPGCQFKGTDLCPPLLRPPASTPSRSAGGDTQAEDAQFVACFGFEGKNDPKNGRQVRAPFLFSFFFDTKICLQSRRSRKSILRILHK